MPEGFEALLGPRSWIEVLRDVVDVLVVWYSLYRVLMLLRGTRAMQVGVGLALVALVYIVAQHLQLATTYALLDRFLASFLLLVVVIFQADIRRALMRVGHQSFLLSFRRGEDTRVVEEVIEACIRLAQRRIGALIVFERGATLDEFLTQGTALDAEVTSELLYTVFIPSHGNPLHDGAAVIRQGRVAVAGAVLPLTSNASLDRQLGTRHRAGMGATEETDAIVVVVSEERGEISMCFNGNIVRGLDAQSLRRALFGVLYPKLRVGEMLRTSMPPAPRVSVVPGPVGEKPASEKPAPREPTSGVSEPPPGGAT